MLTIISIVPKSLCLPCRALICSSCIRRTEFFRHPSTRATVFRIYGRDAETWKIRNPHGLRQLIDETSIVRRSRLNQKHVYGHSVRSVLAPAVFSDLPSAINLLPRCISWGWLLGGHCNSFCALSRGIRPSRCLTALSGLPISRSVPSPRKNVGKLEFTPVRGSDRDSTHSGDVDYAALLSSLFELQAGTFMSRWLGNRIARGC
jgi:hypothetical protein